MVDVVRCMEARKKLVACDKLVVRAKRLDEAANILPFIESYSTGHRVANSSGREAMPALAKAGSMERTNSSFETRSDRITSNEIHTFRRHAQFARTSPELDQSAPSGLGA